MTDKLPVKCGYCGVELESLSADHTCKEQFEVFAYMATGDLGVFEDD